MGLAAHADWWARWMSLAGMAVLFAPRGLPLVYMTVWALWTALLRPLAGESFFETLERAGNYGVPFALILLTAMPRSVNGLGTPSGAVRRRTIDRSRWRVEDSSGRRCCCWSGTGRSGIANKPGVDRALRRDRASAGNDGDGRMVRGRTRGCCRFGPIAGLVVFVAAWKLATEFLFVVAGSPIWEFVERGGSYAAPLALAILGMKTLQHGGHGEPRGTRSASMG